MLDVWLSTQILGASRLPFIDPSVLRADVVWSTLGVLPTLDPRALGRLVIS